MLKPKKILFVVGGSTVSGAEIVMLNVMEGLRNNGYEIKCVVSGWNDGDFIERLEELRIPYYVIKLGFLYVSKLNWTLDTLIHLPRAWLQYWRIQNTFKPDISYHVCFRSIFMLLPFLKQDVTILHVEDAIHVNRVNRFFHYIIDKKVTKYIACSNFINRHLQKFGINPAKIITIYNGVKVKDIPDRRMQGVQKEGLPVRIGIVGQLLPQKGHLTLIEALRMLKEKGKNFILKIYGKGDQAYIKRLKDKIKQFQMQDNVEWMGFVKEQNQIYPHLDIVVVPSILEEPFALVAIESGFFGVPLIVSNKGGSPEIAIDRETGLLFEAGDPIDLCSKLGILIEDSSLRERLSRNARSHAEKKFTAEIMCRQIEEIL